MANIELVIKIDEDTLQDLYDSRYVSPHIKDVFRSATILPKGHGDLVDISKLDGEWVCTQDGNYECIKECSCENCEYSEYQCYTDIRDLPVVVEADKESENDIQNKTNMTREEAIEILKKYKTESEEDYYVNRAKALGMAIEALWKTW